MAKVSIYQQMLAAGQECHNHSTDLYVYVNEVTRKIVAEYEFKSNVTTFKSQTDGKMMYDIPFAYEPEWEARTKR
jgi:hypothetical protein